MRFDADLPCVSLRNQSMMDKTIAFAFSTVFAVILVFASMAVITNKQDNDAIERLVASGAHPMDAFCAIRGSSHHAAICAVRSIKE